MKKLHVLLAVLAATLFFGGMAGAEMYKWVDENGITRFSDTPPREATPSGKVETRRMPEYVPPAVGTTSPSAGKPRVPPVSSPSSLSPSAPKVPNKVELYVTSWCPWCKKASEYFRSRGISFVEYDIEKDRAAAQRKMALDRDKGVPFAVVNGKFIKGYDPSSYEAALGNSP